MKKNLFLCLVMLFALKAHPQVLLYETFDNMPGPTSGGAGTYSFPANWLVYNVDNLPNDPGRTWFSNAWLRCEDFDNLTDTCAASSSWYSPPGTSNDFMWMPLISLPAGTSTLTWNARSASSGYEDAYEVRIMTVAPTGGTGNIGNQLSNSTVIFSTLAESFSWVSHSVNLSAYGGQDVYIGFRNISNDRDVIFIDDIKVEALNPYDAAVVSTNIEYTIIPSGQGIPLSAKISNVGGLPLTNVALQVNIYNSLGGLVHSATSAPVASIPVLGDASFTIPSFAPPINDVYYVEYTHVQTEIDANTLNDELIDTVTVAPNVFARDNGNIIGGLGIGAGNGGYIGQSFTLSNPAYLYSVTCYYTKGYFNFTPYFKYGCAIWNTDVNGTPTTILAVTDTNLYQNVNPLLATSPIYGGTILLPAGTYVVTTIEFDTLSIGITDKIFTEGKLWVNWPTSPSGGWIHPETVGFPNPYSIRMNIGPNAFPLPSEALILSGKSLDHQHELTWSHQEKRGSKYEYTLQRSEDAKKWQDVYSESAHGKDEIRKLFYNDSKGVSEKSYYRVRVMNLDNELKYSNMISLFNSDKEVLVEVFPNPAKDIIHLNTNRYKNTTYAIYDIQGKMVLSQALDEANTIITLQGLHAGTYTLKLSNANEVIYSNKLIVQ